MTPDNADIHAKQLIGRKLLSIEMKDYSWLLEFDAGASLVTESPWRLIEQGRIAVSSGDHGQQFGLTAPMNAARAVMSRVGGRTVEAASIASDSGDLMLEFQGRTCLQLLQLSSGYEAWRLSIDGNESICMGGGNIAHFPRS